MTRSPRSHTRTLRSRAIRSAVLEEAAKLSVGLDRTLHPQGRRVGLGPPNEFATNPDSPPRLSSRGPEARAEAGINGGEAMSTVIARRVASLPERGAPATWDR